MMRKTEGGKSRLFRKAAACVLAAAFLLSACGMTNKASSAEDREIAYSQSAPAEAEGYSAYDTESGGYNVAMEDSADAGFAAEESMDENYAPEKEAEPQPAAGGEGAEDISNRKIVYTGNISLQTLEYDASAKSIHDKITGYGGFIESEYTSNEDPYWYYRDRSGSAAKRTRRTLNVTARVPAEKFDAFMEDLKKDGQVISTSVNAQNISVSYATHDASRKALEIEQERLLGMMDKAQTIEEMIAVEKRLTEVERELGNEKTTLSAMDRDVNFSTVDIQLEEVFEYSETVVEVTYGERLKRAFGNAIEGFAEFWKGVLLFIVGSFPFLIMWGILIFVLVKILRRSHRRRMEKRAAMDEARRKASDAGRFGAPLSFTNRFRPAEPVNPAEPVGPVQPAEPIRPSQPVNPAAPAGPVDPVRPAAPAGPAEPGIPDSAEEPAEQPEEQAGPAEVEQNGPAEAEQNGPVEGVEAAEAEQAEGPENS